MKSNYNEEFYSKECFKACPFCGGKVELEIEVDKFGDKIFDVFCESYCIGMQDRNYSFLRRRWNRRYTK